jgi:hypothetical protein
MNSSSTARKFSRILGGAVALGASAAMLVIGSSADAAALNVGAQSLTSSTSRLVMGVYGRGI